LFDRSIDEDAYVFCRMHHERGLLDDHQYTSLQNIAYALQNAMPGPDLVLFVNPGRRILAKRVTLASHPEPIVESLGRQVSLYAEWLRTRREDVLGLDNSRCSLQAVARLLSERVQC
jgi:deoxyadenosine/deoxycytidine kinase